MREEQQGPRTEPEQEPRSELEKKYRIALALYVVLAVLAWFTIGEGKIEVFHRMIEIRWVPIFILATFVFRTVMAMQADRIRRDK